MKPNSERIQFPDALSESPRAGFPGGPAPGRNGEPSRVLIVFGTRPEAIKLCPLVHHLRANPASFDARVCVTAQHRDMLDQVLTVFGVRPEFDLNLMRPAQDLASLTARILQGIQDVLAQQQPHMVVVQGDTTTTLATALAAFYHRIPIAHVEAGLRTGDLQSPYPEEMNRVLTTRLADLHFAPTTLAADNLRREGVPRDRITVTGNTGIDAVLHIRAALEAGRLQGCAHLPLRPHQPLILVTAHRRESFGEGLHNICSAVASLAARHDVQLVFAVHPNPNVQRTVKSRLGGLQNVVLTEALSYVDFVDLMRRSLFILTDSGGIQEEAPSLGKPILVLRDKTERPEAVAAGTSLLVGTSPERILSEARILLENRQLYFRRSQAANPFGDGTACRQISAVIRSFCTTNRSVSAASGQQ